MDRTTATFEERVKDLPTNEVLTALAAISNDPETARRPFDLLRLRIAELLLVCGFRIGEALTMPANALVREPVLDEAGKPRLDASTGEAVERIGLRYWPEKGGEPVVKWIPTIANPLVLRAVEDIERICRPARDNALWLEAHPGDVNLDILPGDLVSVRRITELLGLANKSFHTWLRTRNRRDIIVGTRANARIRGSDLRTTVAMDRYDRPMMRRDDGRIQSLGESLIVYFFTSPLRCAERIASFRCQ